MKSKTDTLKNPHALLRSSIALATAGLITIGLSACDNNDAITENETSMQEPINNAQSTTPDVTSNTTTDQSTIPSADTSSDTWITAKVKTELLADDVSKGFDIEVTTVDGVVSLDGQVKNAESVMHVQQIANSVEGVLQVDASGLMLEETKAY